jgi:hypothetical protein
VHLPLTAAARQDVQWRWSYGTKLSTLRELAEQDCRFRALLGFVRVPYVTDKLGTSERIAGDLRYDRAEGLDFSDMRLDLQADCPAWLPPWIPPRSDLIPVVR